MSTWDLLFLLLVATSLVTFAAVVVIAFRGRFARAGKVLLVWGLCAGCYVGVVYLTTFFSTPRVIAVGSPHCNDDWCLAVTGVAATQNGTYRLTLSIFSTAARVDQREMGAVDVYLEDAAGARYNPQPDPTATPLNVLLHAGERVVTGRTFQVPAGAHGLAMFVERRDMPLCLVIGECQAFHKGPRVPLQITPTSPSGDERPRPGAVRSHGRWA